MGSWSPLLLISFGNFLQLPLLLVKASITPSFQTSPTLPVSMLNVFFSYENLLLVRPVLKLHPFFSFFLRNVVVREKGYVCWVLSCFLHIHGWDHHFPTCSSLSRICPWKNLKSLQTMLPNGFSSVIIFLVFHCSTPYNLDTPKTILPAFFGQNKPFGYNN